MYNEHIKGYVLFHNGENYYYVKNTLGDIIAIRNSAGTEVASYNYDAWGNVIDKYGTMADINPFRYRGYYYDTETGFYYLQTRYYDPTTRLFINADNYELISTLAEIPGQLNMYGYCNNNPIMFTDPTDESFLGKVLFNALISYLCSYFVPSESSIPFANVVRMSNASTSESDDIALKVFGNITYTTTIQHNRSGLVFAFVNEGNSVSSVGVGFNLGNQFGASLYVSSNIGLGLNVQITPYHTFGIEISVFDGISFSFGLITEGVTNEVTISIGWGSIAAVALISYGLTPVVLLGA